MNTVKTIHIRNAKPEEYKSIGQLMVEVYSNLEGFPSPEAQPKYYELLRNVGEFIRNPTTELIIAVDEQDYLLGTVVYFAEMQHYGSGGSATQEKEAGAFRLLAVSPNARGLGIGKRLTMECIERTKNKGLKQVIIHSTKAMMTAWNMYEKIGFKRAEELDFMQQDFPVFGFRLKL